MKKIVIVCSFLLLMYLISYDEYNISEDSIRFRVIANSNSIKDILMKERVVRELSTTLFKDFKDKETAENNIYENLQIIEKKIEKLFKDNNYNQNFNISYGLNEFPKKRFLGKTYKEGLYNSLVIEIGDAKGNNYFCILYPSLCMIDYNDDNSNDGYKIKIFELFKEIF